MATTCGTKYCDCLCHQHCSACDGGQIVMRSPEVKQIEISFWHKDQSPVDDAPRERGGVMQDTLEATIAFAAEAIRSHWNGECDCQRKNDGCICQGCGSKFQVDVLIPDSLWERIKPIDKSDTAGLLCGACIFARIESLGEFGMLNLTKAE